MTLEEIEQDLPNGLHDAQIQQIEMDYEEARLALRVKVLLGLPGEPTQTRERYRPGMITFLGVQFFSIEPKLFVIPGVFGSHMKR